MKEQIALLKQRINDYEAKLRGLGRELVDAQDTIDALKAKLAKKKPPAKKAANKNGKK